MTMPAAPPRPWSRRAAARVQTVGAAAHSSDATVYSARPMSSGRLRPYVSLRGPLTSCPRASPMRHAVSVSCTSAGDAPSSVAICGRPGRYMSMDSGANADRAPTMSTSSTRRCGSRGPVIDIRFLVRERGWPVERGRQHPAPYCDDDDREGRAGRPEYRRHTADDASSRIDRGQRRHLRGSWSGCPDRGHPQRARLRGADAHPARGDPAAAGRPRRARRGTHGHRQDRRLRAADHPAPCQRARQHPRGRPAPVTHRRPGRDARAGAHP